MKDKTQYSKYCEGRAKKSPLLTDVLKAYLIGGLICAFGQGLTEIYTSLNINADTVKTLVPVTLIFIASILTGIGIFDNIAKFAGAGTLVPITGFSNAVVSTALDSKGEGFILGVGANMFKIAGPVIAYGTAASAVYGLIYWMCKII
ncbi:MAG: stage V sporulation protein AC [Ruminococcaceae bacterium]|nr:stage V sporulation protein AC [Oscillospiraceae bacterium]